MFPTAYVVRFESCKSRQAQKVESHGRAMQASIGRTSSEVCLEPPGRG